MIPKNFWDNIREQKREENVYQITCLGVCYNKYSEKKNFQLNPFKFL